MLKQASTPTSADAHPIEAGRDLPAQEIHAVFPSPKLVPQKVLNFIAHLQQGLAGDWWLRVP